MKDPDRIMIIGLSGYKQSGKDTVAAYLVKEHQFERKAFADPLKKSVAALFDIPFSDVDKLKNQTYATATVESKDGSLHDMTFRTFLQRYGTEAHRDIFGQDFWVDQTLPVRGFYPGRAIVVTDVRFSNEAVRVRELGGLVVRVFREIAAPIEKTLHRVEDRHTSEVIDFDWDYSLSNNGSLENLYASIEDMLCYMVDKAEMDRTG